MRAHRLRTLLTRTRGDNAPQAGGKRACASDSRRRRAPPARPGAARSQELLPAVTVVVAEGNRSCRRQLPSQRAATTVTAVNAHTTTATAHTTTSHCRRPFLGWLSLSRASTSRSTWMAKAQRNLSKAGAHSSCARASSRKRLPRETLQREQRHAAGPPARQHHLRGTERDALGLPRIGVVVVLLGRHAS